MALCTRHKKVDSFAVHYSKPFLAHPVQSQLILQHWKDTELQFIVATDVCQTQNLLGIEYAIHFRSLPQLVDVMGKVDYCISGYATHVFDGYSANFLSFLTDYLISFLLAYLLS